MIYALSILLFLSILITVYPYLIYPMLLRLLPTKAISHDPHHVVTMTLAFCAFNEGKVIVEKLNNIAMLKSYHPELEILAFDDGSSDNTYEQLSARPDLLSVIKGRGRNGKAYGMKKLAKLAKGDIIIFTDANVLLDELAVKNLQGWYADPAIGGVCGTLKYIDSKETATASAGGLYWRFEERLKSEEARTGNVMGADGSIFSLRRSLYPAFPDTVLDDLTVSMAAVFAGKRLIKAPNVIAYERLITSRKEEFSRKIRIATRAYHTHLYLRPQLSTMSKLDRFKYTSRKFIRWFGGFFLIIASFLALFSSATISPTIFSITFLILLGAIWFGKYSHNGYLATAIEITLSMIATFIGVIRAIKGDTLATWAPAKTR